MRNSRTCDLVWVAILLVSCQRAPKLPFICEENVYEILGTIKRSLCSPDDVKGRSPLALSLFVFRIVTSTAIDIVDWMRSFPKSGNFIPDGAEKEYFVEMLVFFTVVRVRLVKLPFWEFIIFSSVTERSVLKLICIPLRISKFMDSKGRWLVVVLSVDLKPVCMLKISPLLFEYPVLGLKRRMSGLNIFIVVSG